MKAVLDSSVLVSAFLSPAGTPAALIAHARRGAFSLRISHGILAETTGALLGYRHRSRRQYTIEEVHELGVLLEVVAGGIETGLPEVHVVPADPKDDMVVATALAAGADFLVSGDRHLLSLRTHRGIRIVTPRQLLDLLQPEPPA